VFKWLKYTLNVNKSTVGGYEVVLNSFIDHYFKCSLQLQD